MLRGTKSKLNPVALVIYDPDLDLDTARRKYWADNEFGDDGGYGAKWVHIKFGPFPAVIPNTPARVEAVRFHDLHHLITGYDTDLRGEAEIAAWELRTGCGRFVAAWILNLLALTYGVLLCPRRLWRAWRRARGANNTYSLPFSDDLLARRLGEVRDDLKTRNDVPDGTVGEALGFAALCGGALTLACGGLVAVACAVGALLNAVL
jgi:hypothetical protein